MPSFINILFYFVNVLSACAKSELRILTHHGHFTKPLFILLIVNNSLKV